MSDQFALIDARGRAAGTALRAATSMRALPDAPAPHRRGWVRVAFVVTALVALIVGLVAISGRDAAPVDDHDPKNLRYLIDDLPEGWSVTVRTEATGEAVDQTPGIAMALYGTTRDPMAPVMLVRWSSPDSPDGQSSAGSGFAGFGSMTGVQEFRVGDWPSACGIDASQRVQCRVETDRGFVQIAARRLSIDEAQAMVSGLAFVDDIPLVAPEALPAGMSLLYSGPFGTYFTAGSSFSGRAAATQMNGPNAAQAMLTVGWADDTDIAYLGLDEGWTPTTVDGQPAYRQAVHQGDETIVWVADGRTFWLNVINADGLADSLASGVRAATVDEWEAIPQVPSADNAGTVVATSAAGTEPVDSGATETLPSPTLDPSAAYDDVEVSTDLTPRSDHSVDASVPGASGAQPVTVSISYVVDTYEVRGEDGGGFIRRSPVTDAELQFVPSGNAPGLFALSEDPAAAELVVLSSDGNRYHAALQPLFDGKPGRFAMIGVPSARFIGAQVLTADGSVLAEIPFGR